MDTDIINSPDLKDTAENLFGSISKLPRIIYILMLCFISVCAVLMAFIKFPVFVESEGTLRPSSEKKVICSPLEGLVGGIYVYEGQKVKKGDLILSIDSAQQEEQLSLLREDLQKTFLYIVDCNHLLNNRNCTYEKINTSKYQTEFLTFIHTVHMSELEISQLENDIEKLKPLEKDSLISRKEMETMETKLVTMKVTLEREKNTRKRQWQEQADDLIQKKISLQGEITNLEHYIRLSCIRSPGTGSIQGIRNIFKGELCPYGKQICTLIPDTSLVIEMFIPSHDIGFISPGTKTRFKVNAFDYNYWGFIKGECISISSDFEIVENMPFFRVICRPDEPCTLSYRDKTVHLNPGLSVTTQFLLANRSLWQLLRDKALIWVSD